MTDGDDRAGAMRRGRRVRRALCVAGAVWVAAFLYILRLRQSDGGGHVGDPADPLSSVSLRRPLSESDDAQLLETYWTHALRTREAGSFDRFVVTFEMTRDFALLAATSSNHADVVYTNVTFCTGSFDGGPWSTRVVRAKVSLWGKASISLRNSRRRTFRVALSEPVSLPARAGLVPMPRGGEDTTVREFVLLSLWEDHNRLKYRTSARLLADAGIWPMRTLYAEVRLRPIAPRAYAFVDGECGGLSQGVYLLLEFPTDAAAREAGVPVGSVEMAVRKLAANDTTRNREVTGKESASLPLMTFPTFREGSPLWPCYAAAARSPRAFEAAYDVRTYIVWLAMNSFLMNSDYGDEAYVWAVAPSARGLDDARAEREDPCGGRRLFISPWDYDSILSPCHHKSVDAVNDTLLFCAEAAVDRFVAHDPVLRSVLVESMRELAGGVMSVARVRAAFSESLAQLFAHANVGTPHMNGTADIYKAVELTRRYEARYNTLVAALGKET